MIHISIEGMDGVGKTSTSKLVAGKLGFKFVEKPLHYIVDEGDDTTNYRKIAKAVNSDNDRNFTAWYYGLNNLYVYDRFKGQSIVTDRHVVSNYAWSGTDYNGDIYDLILKKIGAPTLTVILYSDAESIVKRLKQRDPNDKDIDRVIESERIYSRMIDFCQKKKMPYVIVDSSSLSLEETANEIIKRYKELEADGE